MEKWLGAWDEVLVYKAMNSMVKQISSSWGLVDFFSEVGEWIFIVQ